MVVLANTKMSKKKGLNDKFEKYLKKQCAKPTYNGMEIAAFSWYKKALGF
ncbi:MAG: hypothetical protein PHV68_06180 [Candidatus Gastranaerophilales bacterium]|nr:hypothetical protein [Candidatus Gastranaerophilales bacterium]